MPGGVRWWKYNQGWRETEFLLLVSGCWPKKASIVEPACFVSLKAFVHMFVCKHLLATAVAMLLPHCCLSKRFRKHVVRVGRSFTVFLQRKCKHKAFTSLYLSILAVIDSTSRTISMRLQTAAGKTKRYHETERGFAISPYFSLVGVDFCCSGKS